MVVLLPPRRDPWATLPAQDFVRVGEQPDGSKERFINTESVLTTLETWSAQLLTIPDKPETFDHLTNCLQNVCTLDLDRPTVHPPCYSYNHKVCSRGY